MDELNYIKPGRYKTPVDADARRDEFDLKNGEVLYSGKPVDIIFTGDSITHFMDVNLYYSRFGLVLNRGIGGDVANILAWRFHAVEAAPMYCIGGCKQHMGIGQQNQQKRTVRSARRQ